MKIWCWIAFLSFYFLQNSLGQSSNTKRISQYVLDAWQTDKGLVSNSILAIHQDQAGFIWMGTYEGLVRFDGKAFSTYSSRSHPEIIDHQISAIKSNSDTLIFASTKGFIYTLVNDSISVLSSGLGDELSDFEINESKLYVISKNGIQSVEIVSGIKEMISDSKTFTSILAVNKTLILGTEDGQLLSYQKSDQSFTTLGKVDGAVDELFLDKEEQLWIGTGVSLYLKSKGSKTIRKVQLNEDEESETPVKAIIQDGNKDFWVGTRKGLYRYQKGRFDRFSTDDGLTHNDIRSLIQDDFGNIWIGTYRGGLNRLFSGPISTYTMAEGLECKLIYAVTDDKEDGVWVGGYGALHRISKTGDISRFTHPNFNDELIRTIAVESEDILWVGTYGYGLYRIQLKTRKVTQITAEDGLSSDIVRSLYIDSNNILWIGTRTGLNAYQNGTLKMYDTGEINQINAASDGKLWLSSDGRGIIQFDGKTFKEFSIDAGLSSSVTLTSLAHNNHVFIGATNGFNVIVDEKVYSLRHLGEPFNLGVHQILHTDNYLWLGTAQGVFRIKEDDVIRTLTDETNSIEKSRYGKAEGMKSIFCTAPGLGFVSESGDLWFPTSEGVSRVKQEMIVNKVLNREIKITSMLVNGKSISEDAKSIGPGVKRLEIGFTSAVFNNPDAVQFSYKLEGFDDNWILDDGKRNALYTNVSPGFQTFTIRVQSPYIQSGTVISIPINVLPYYYQTWWFNAFIIILIGGLIFGIYRLRIYRIKRQAEKLEEIIEVRSRQLKDETNQRLETERKLIESEKMASLGGLVAGVAHEINTPLGSAVTASSTVKSRVTILSKKMELNQMKKSDLLSFIDFMKEGAEIIEKNLDRAAQLVRSFKQVAVDQTSEQRRTFFVKDYINEIALNLKPNFKNTKHKLEVDCDGSITLDSFPGLWSQILSNLIVNAQRHGFESPDFEGIISVHVVDKQNDLLVILKDNGKGMSDDVRQHIFDPFFTTKPNQGGTGLGLHIIYNIVTQKLKGEISCESELGVGTTFTIRVPIQLSE